MAEAVGLFTSREVWLALEISFSHQSKARELHLKDNLQLMKCGTCLVAEYSCVFKALCDQLHAIGHLDDRTYKVYWFLRGLGANFSTFSTAQMALTHLPTFADIVPKAKSFEIFEKSLDSSRPSAAAFTITKGSSQDRWGCSSHNR